MVAPSRSSKQIHGMTWEINNIKTNVIVFDIYATLLQPCSRNSNNVDGGESRGDFACAIVDKCLCIAQYGASRLARWPSSAMLGHASRIRKFCSVNGTRELALSEGRAPMPGRCSLFEMTVSLCC